LLMLKGNASFLEIISDISVDPSGLYVGHVYLLLYAYIDTYLDTCNTLVLCVSS